MTRYAIITVDTWKTIADNFKTLENARNWALAHDYGQYEEDGGLRIVPYTV